jgi:hypothetical protein
MSFGLVMSLKELAERLDKTDAALVNAAIIAIDKADAEEAKNALSSSCYPEQRSRQTD